jgi:hypothetical protein
MSLASSYRRARVVFMVGFLGQGLGRLALDIAPGRKPRIKAAPGTRKTHPLRATTPPIGPGLAAAPQATP